MLPHPLEQADGLAVLAQHVDAAIAATPDILHDDDLQLSLFVLYGLNYGSVVAADDDWEWNPGLIAIRGAIERAFEAALRERVPAVPLPPANREAVAEALFELTKPSTGPSLSKYVARQATDEQLHELVIQRSVYTLKEADPHSWGIPRLYGRAKAAMMEIQADEYGGGNATRMHSAIYAGLMRLLGLDDRYGAYVNQVPAITLTSLNMSSMFGLNRRLRGAVCGHLAAFEMTSAIPSRYYGNGFRRLGYGEDVTWYYDEHVEADSVHEQIAGRDLAGSLAEDEPQLLPDILFGANACLTIDGWAGDHILASWEAGRSSLRVPLAPAERVSA
ncbi:iron-containing redox enzyme family protein [Cryobacterium tepidiphilum]|uniref:Iron-containing redox enzyme family protein n=2 Tax=Cryobacterium tepidiphilum TaxID=2486026 RepID=A0A3M8KUT5_9MICO|nr:iron-containing redox enzyme family protein [Cryobacterium tepidiphilum]RNE57023.1 iron-containing redox enzyme family protein [Cryobacterium tepidiphilum]